MENELSKGLVTKESLLSSGCRKYTELPFVILSVFYITIHQHALGDANIICESVLAFFRAARKSRKWNPPPVNIHITLVSTVPSKETAPLATAEGLETEAEAAEAPTEVAGGEGFCVLESAPVAHRFHLSMLQPSEPRSFYSAVKREIKLLKSDLPPGVCTPTLHISLPDQSWK